MRGSPRSSKPQAGRQERARKKTPEEARSTTVHHSLGRTVKARWLLTGLAPGRLQVGDGRSPGETEHIASAAKGVVPGFVRADLGLKPVDKDIYMLRPHAGWNLALNRQLGEPLFHSTTLTRFRDRLEEYDLAAVGPRAILDGPIHSGLVRRRTN